MKTVNFSILDEYMSNIALQSVVPIYINIWNVESSVGISDVHNFYKDLKFKEIIKNSHKQGNFDCIFATHKDAIKFIRRGTGVLIFIQRIKDRSFYMRMSYRNTQDSKQNPDDISLSSFSD